jgi:hypothetical protein
VEYDHEEGKVRGLPVLLASVLLNKPKFLETTVEYDHEEGKVRGLPVLLHPQHSQVPGDHSGV